MDAFRPQRSPGSDRFLGLLAHSDLSPPIAADPAPGVELLEDEVLWNDSPKPSSPITSPISIPASKPYFRRPSFPRNFGILAALPEEDERPIPKATSTSNIPAFLQHNRSVSTGPSSSTSPTSSARTIPAPPKPKEYGMSMPGKAYHQSAPVNVPMPAMKPRKGWGEGDGGGEDIDDEEMLPPHEIVARASHQGSPMTTFSVLEGAGRTLKGRDLRRVRNAVFHKTGFLD